MDDLEKRLAALEADIARISATAAVLWYVKFGEWPEENTDD